MTQFARPDADTNIGNFVDHNDGTNDIFQTLNDESADDTAYIKSPTSPDSEVYVCSLSDVNDPDSSSGHIMRMRTSVDLDDEETLDFTQELRQDYTDEETQGTLIASQSRNGVTSTTWTTSSNTLSSAEADSITDYTSLFYRFVVNTQ